MYVVVVVVVVIEALVVAHLHYDRCDLTSLVVFVIFRQN